MSINQSIEPLRIESDPFVTAGSHVGGPLRAAFHELIRHIKQKTPFVLVIGGASTGKTSLVDLTVRACAELGFSVNRVDRGDLEDMPLGQSSDVLLVDEANSIPDSVLEAISQKEGDRPATTSVFLGFPSCITRGGFSKLGPVIIELTPLPPSDARNYLLERAGGAGLPDLFAAEALDVIVRGAAGSPRLLRSLARFAFFRAVSDGASQIGVRHAASAVAFQTGSDTENDYESGVSASNEVSVQDRRKAGERPATWKLADRIDWFANVHAPPAEAASPSGLRAQAQFEGEQPLARKSDVPVGDPEQVDIDGLNADRIAWSVRGDKTPAQSPRADEIGADTRMPASRIASPPRAETTPEDSAHNVHQFRALFQETSRSAWMMRKNVAAVCIVVVAGAAIAMVLPSLRDTTNSYEGTNPFEQTGPARPDNAPPLRAGAGFAEPVQPPSAVGPALPSPPAPAVVQVPPVARPTTALPPNASSAAERLVAPAPALTNAKDAAQTETQARTEIGVPKNVPAAPAKADVARTERQASGVVEVAKSAPAAPAVRSVGRRPLTDEEKAAIERGIRELERAAKDTAPLSARR